MVGVILTCETLTLFLLLEAVTSYSDVLVVVATVELLQVRQRWVLGSPSIGRANR